MNGGTRRKNKETKLGIGSVSRGPDGGVDEEKQRQPLLCRVARLFIYLTPSLAISFGRHGDEYTSPARITTVLQLYPLSVK